MSLVFPPPSLHCLFVTDTLCVCVGSHEANDTLVSGSLHRDCQGGAAAFKALKLNNLFDVSTLTNFTKVSCSTITVSPVNETHKISRHYNTLRCMEVSEKSCLSMSSLYRNNNKH